MNQGGGSGEFQYKAQATLESAPVLQPAQASVRPPVVNEVRWEASEFVDHQKSAGWFGLLAVAALFGAGLMYIITQSIFSTLLVVLAVVAFGVTARQKPRTLVYTITAGGLKIGTKVYKFDDFKAFSILQEGGIYSVLLEPMKRFMPPVSIYFDPADGEKIFDALAQQLPHVERKRDAIDSFMQRIRF